MFNFLKDRIEINYGVFTSNVLRSVKVVGVSSEFDLPRAGDYFC